MAIQPTNARRSSGPRVWRALPLVVLLAVLAPWPAAADLFYKVEKAIRLADLNPGAGGNQLMSVTGLNDAGSLAGYFPDGNYAKLHAFLWDNAAHTLLDLNASLEADSSLATCLAADGTVAGVFWSADGSYTETGFVRLPNGTIATFLPPGGGTIVWVQAINSAHQVVGVYLAADTFQQRGFFWQPGGTGEITDLGDLDDMPNAVRQSVWPQAINAAGQVAAIDFVQLAGNPASYTDRAFLWDQGQVRVVDAPAGF